MFQGADDLCSTVSNISSSFTEFDDDGRQEENLEPPEIKFVPPEVKAEIPDNIGSVTENDIDDEFLNRYLGDDAAGVESVDFIKDPPPPPPPPPGTIAAKRRKPTARKKTGGGGLSSSVRNDDLTILEDFVEGGGAVRREGRRRAFIFVKKEDDSADDADDDNDWMPVGNDEIDDDWRPGSPKKRTASSRSTGPRRSASNENQSDTSTVARRRQKRIGEMTPERAAKERARWNEYARKRKTVKDMTEEERQKVNARSARRRAMLKQRREKSEATNDDIKNEGTGEGESDASSYQEKSSGRRRKRVSEMTPEEREAAKEKWRKELLRRQEKRAAMDPEKREAEKAKARERQRLRRALANQDALSEDQLNGGTGEGESDASSFSMGTVRLSGRRKKRLSEMTPEEKEAAKAKWRKEHLRRQEKRAAMDPQKREAEKAKARERQRIRRALAKQGALPEDQLLSMEEQYKKDRERKRAKRAAMTPEQKREEMQKNTMYRLARMARMTDEEKRARRIHNYMQRVARLSTMTQEEKDKLKEKKRLKGVSRYYKLKEKLGIEGIREMRRNYWHSMAPDRKEKALAKLRECHAKRVQRLKEEGRWEEVKQKWAKRDKAYKKKKRESGEGIRRSNRKGKTGRPRTVQSGARKKWAEMTEEEKEQKRHQRRLWALKKKLAIQKLLDTGMSMEEIHQQTQSPEQRERRLIQQRIRKAKRNLRQRLESFGAPPEEIEKKVEELKHTYTPTYPFRPYKPRPENWKPVDPNLIPDIEALGEVEIKCKDSNTPLLPRTKPRTRRRRVATSTTVVGTTTTEATTIKEEPLEPSPPRRRGRPLKYPPNLPYKKPLPPSIATVIAPAATTTTGVIVSPPQVPPISTIATLQAPQQPQPSSSSTSQTLTLTLTPTTVYPPSQPPFSQYEATIYPHSSQSIFPFPLQQQPPPPSSQSYTLQHILDGITYHDAGTSATSSTPVPVIPAPQQYHHQYDHSTTSSQHEYGSSYYDDDNHSHPTSPGGGGFEDFSDYSSYSHPPPPTAAPPPVQNNLSLPPPPTLPPPQPVQLHQRLQQTSQQRQPPPPPIVQNVNVASFVSTDPSLEPPKKPKKPRNRKYVYRPPKNPNAKLRTKRKDVIRDCVCDECGQGYNRMSLKAHKNQLHNPNYDIANRTCLICGEKYKHAQRWYTHYLRVHVRPLEALRNKTHMCEECGQGFVNMENYRKHQYYMHGDGLKKENHIRCPVCPEEKLFKEKMGYHSHLNRFHPDYVRPGHDCYRCDKSFPNERVLAEHVGANHKDSYFPCPYCKACKFTQLGLNFHYSRCTKITKEEKADVKSKWVGIFSLEWTPIPCELCQKQIMLSSLTRHYNEMHNVREDPFSCADCKKEFKVRCFWANHLEEKHQMKLEDVLKKARELNCKDRTGISVKPLKSLFRGGGRRRKTKPESGSEGSRGRMKMGRRNRRRGDSDDDEEDSEDWMSENSDSEYSESAVRKEKKNGNNFKTKRKRRKIVVIADEDGEDDRNVNINIVKASLLVMNRQLNKN